MFALVTRFRVSRQIPVRTRAHIASRRRSMSVSTVSNPLSAAFLRGGTSKGIYLNRSHLPEDRAKWDPIFLGIMGSPDPVHGRQLNGMGGGISSLSKICVVGPPSPAQRADGIDVEYTFCQVGIRDAELDYSGNCGNLSSMIGVFAVDEGLCAPRVVLSGDISVGVVRAFNANTNKRIDTTFPVSLSPEGRYAADLGLPQTTMAGVPGRASRIDLDFVSPAGARTGKLLPSGAPVDSLSFSLKGSAYSIRASLIDATNPTVFVLSADLAAVMHAPDGKLDYSKHDVEECVEAIRQSGARAMGLDPLAKAQPKIAVLSPQQALQDVGADAAHIVAHAFSMGVLHKAIPMTLGLCLGVAARTEGTLPWEIIRDYGSTGDHKDFAKELVRIRHPSGEVDVGAEFDGNGLVKSAKVVRTGRRLMKGAVWW
ncbi:hypothetical protein M0805_009009 [Coniferiporia weirii]|nr:hypothetical protein M0805_009009 [Coniferiporia weirii]